MMQGDSFLDAILRMVMRFLASNPKMQALARVALIESIAQISFVARKVGAPACAFSDLLERTAIDVIVISIADSDGKAVNLYDYIGFLAGATKALSDKVTRLEGEVRALRRVRAAGP